MLSEAELQGKVNYLVKTKELNRTDREMIAEFYYQIGKQKLYDSAFVAGRLTEFEYLTLKSQRLSGNKIA